MKYNFSDMNKVTGNFLKQGDRAFPLDCETLEQLQELTRLACVLGRIGGDKIILSGCGLSKDGAQRQPGYVYLCSLENPEGEVLPYEGGAASDSLYIKTEYINVSTGECEYKKAYTKRSLASGVGPDSMAWSEFAEIEPVRKLTASIAETRRQLSQLQPAPVGSVTLWAGAVVPDDYVLCNGQELKQSEWPELYSAIGSQYNKGMSADGSAYTTQDGYFRVPDLRGRFVVGRHDSDNEYKTNGQSGGAKSVCLKESELPAHRHEVKDYMFVPRRGEGVTGNWTVDGEQMAVGTSTANGSSRRAKTAGDACDEVQWIKHKTESAASDVVAGHENRPPYYTLTYIIRAK